MGQVSESIVSTPTHYNETGTKGLTGQPRAGGRECWGDRVSEWSLTPDLPDITLKMQINLRFRKCSRNRRGQTNLTLKPDKTTKNHLYMLLIKTHSKHTLKVSYTSTPYSKSQTNTQVQNTYKIRVKKKHTCMKIQALTKTKKFHTDDHTAPL